MAEKKQPAILNKQLLNAASLEFSLQGEMLPLLQRVSGNKSKRTAKTLVKDGPLRVLLVTLDAGGVLEEHAVDGPFTVQCLMGRVIVRLGSKNHELGTGDLLVVDAGITHDVTAKDASALLITVAMDASAE